MEKKMKLSLRTSKILILIALTFGILTVMVVNGPRRNTSMYASDAESVQADNYITATEDSSIEESQRISLEEEALIVLFP